MRTSDRTRPREKRHQPPAGGAQHGGRGCAEHVCARPRRNVYRVSRRPSGERVRSVGIRSSRTVLAPPRYVRVGSRPYRRTAGRNVKERDENTFRPRLYKIFYIGAHFGNAKQLLRVICQ
jgi:hypothetical protein